MRMCDLLIKCIWQKWSSKSPSYLVFVFYGVRQTVVYHETHIWLIDTHARGSGGNKYVDFIVNPVLLDLPAPCLWYLMV